jgi:hypothetical protein
MLLMKSLARITIVVLLGSFLLTSGGCGSGSVPVDPQGGEKQKQARINAYGPAGYTKEKGAAGPGPTAESSQAAARRKANGGQ